MALEGEFESMMPDTVTFYAPTTMDLYGKSAHSATPQPFRCRVQTEFRKSVNAEGREVTITGRVFLFGSPALTTQHRIVMPDGTEPVIVAVDVQSDDTGDHHTVVSVGR